MPVLKFKNFDWKASYYIVSPKLSCITLIRAIFLNILVFDLGIGISKTSVLKNLLGESVFLTSFTDYSDDHLAGKSLTW